MSTDHKSGRGRGYIVWLLALIGLLVHWALDEPPPAERPACPRGLDWPEFEASAAAVEAAQTQAIADAAARLETILAQDPAKRSFESTLGAVDALTHEYARVGDRLALLEYASPSPEVRAAAAEAGVALQRWLVENITLNSRLFELIEDYAATVEPARLAPEQRRLLAETRADYRREGMLLSAAEREQLAAWWTRLAELSSAINRNIHDDLGVVAFDRAELEGLSDAQRSRLEREPETGAYLVATGLRPQYELVMRHAARRDTRRRTLAAAQGRAVEPNRPLIHEVIELRTQIARLLGYPSWADYRTEPRMAGTAAAAEGFLRELHTRLEPVFLAEQRRYRDLARAELGDPGFTVAELEASDIPYYETRLREREYSIDEEVVRQYFAEPEIIERIFAVYEQLFNIDVVVVDAPAHRWAAEVEVALVFDSLTGCPLGAIYLDLHPRPGKFTHFASFGLVGGRLRGDGRRQAPIVAIVGNFPAAVGERPPLWSLDDVLTFLHELGHALHDVLDEARYASQSSGAVPLDFVEVPSQTFERWPQDPEVLRRLAAHHETGAPMPDALVEALVAAAHVGAGHCYRRAVGLGLADLAIHGYRSPAEVPESGQGLYDFSNEIFAEYYYDYPEGTAFLAGFEHLFDGYDAGYYSYAWSDAIAADIAARFRAAKHGYADRRLGQRLREELLAVGDSRPVAESVRAFLGRDSTTEALFAELLGAAQNGP